MSRFDRLMQESIPIHRLLGAGPTGGKTYEPPLSAPPAFIKGRLEWQRKKIINDRGEEALSEAVLYTPTRLKPGDLVKADGRNWPVIAVRERKGLYGGASDHWEVSL